jgi:hypothetical protein
MSRGFSISTFVVTMMIFAVSVSHAQQQATCTFKLFTPIGPVNGVNDYGTTVGQDSSNCPLGFIRYANGSTSFVKAPNSVWTVIMARNDNGVSAGYYATQFPNAIYKGFILQSGVFTTFVHPKSVYGTQLNGINKYDTTVGTYFDSNHVYHGFRRYSNGSLVTLTYPGAVNTFANGINDSGTVVGSFEGVGGSHGFIYHSGTWAQVDFPGTGGGASSLIGISDANAMIGINTSNEPPSSFLYANGAFKVISVPNSYETIVGGISANGLISGSATFNTSNGGSYSHGFTATCK